MIAATLTIAAAMMSTISLSGGKIHFLGFVFGTNITPSLWNRCKLPALLLRISVQKHLGKILQRGFAFWKCDLPDAIENFPVPFWRFRNAQSFRDRRNLAVM